MSNGLENEIIRAISDNDIRDVYEMTYAKYIEIWYYETDLNDNGHDDIIVIVRSPLHSGSHGDNLYTAVSLRLIVKHKVTWDFHVACK